MTRFMPKLTARRAVAGTLVAALAALPLAASSSAGAAQTTPRCTTPGLEAWLGVGTGGAAAGSTSYPLELTNVSGRTCHLFGFPGVSAETGGSQVGSAAGRDHSAPETTVTLHPGSTAHAVLRITDVGVFTPATCKPVTADGLRVFPPGAFRAAEIPFRFKACAAKGPVFLHVTAVQPKVGVPGHP
jgi:uncharacterized protein DUF4232